MDHRHREKLLQMREEDQLPQKLNIMVERAELELRRLGCNGLTVRDLVVLSAVVPRVEMVPEDSGKMIPLVAGARVRVDFEGKITLGIIVGKFGKKFKVRKTGEEKYRIFEAQYLEAI